MVLDGRIKEKTILAPIDSKMNKLVIDELKSKYGIFMTKTLLWGRVDAKQHVECWLAIGWESSLDCAR